MTDTPQHQAYYAAVRTLCDTERRIRNMTRWDHPGADTLNGKILASLEARRERLRREVAGLRATLPDPAAPPPFGAVSSHIHFPHHDWQPVGTVTLDDCIGDLPACLRRAP